MKNVEAAIQIALASHLHVFCFQLEGVVKSLRTGGGLKNFRTGGGNQFWRGQGGAEGYFCWGQEGGGQYPITCHVYAGVSTYHRTDFCKILENFSFSSLLCYVYN